MKNLIFLFVILFPYEQSAAQAPVSKNFNTQEGLPSKTIFDVIQDPDGFLWFGTEKGLVRYDGAHFSVFSNPASRSIGVSNLRIDKFKQLRCQNFSGQHFVVLKDSLFLDESIPQAGGYSPVLASNDRIYINAFNKVLISKSKTDTLTFNKEVYTIFNFANTVYTFDSNGIYDLNAELAFKKIPFSLNKESVFYVVTLSNKLFVFPRNKPSSTCYQFFPDFKQNRLNFPLSGILSVRVIDNKFFVGTNEGLYVLNEDLSLAPMSQPLLPGKRVSAAIKEKDGAIWVTTLDDGAFRFNCWTCINHPIDENLSTIQFSNENKYLLVSTEKGKIYEWSNNSSPKTVYEFSSRQNVLALYADTNSGDLFMAGDLLLIKSKSGKTQTYPYAVKHILSIGKDSFLLSRSGGLILMHKSKTKTIEENWAFRELLTSINIRVRSSAYNPKRNSIYASSSIGLLYINEGKERVLKDGASDITANDLQIMGDTLIAATNKGLLFIMNDKIIGRINSTNSILPSSIQRIQIQKDALWLLADNMFFKTLLPSHKIQFLNISNDFQANSFLINENKLFISSDKGLVIYNHSIIENGTKPLNLLIENFATEKKSLSIVQQNNLGYLENNIQIDFAVPFFEQSENLNVFYKINNEEWRTIEKNQRKISLLALQPDNYHIKIKAKTKDGRSSATKHLHFTIKQPFWKTWWFYFFSIIFVIGLGLLLYKYRLNLVNKKNELEKQTITLENKLRESILASVKAQMNPHFIFNALNTIQSFIYLNDKNQATEYLGKFSQLTRTILEMSNKNAVSLEDEINAMLLYLELEKMRFDEAMNFTIEVAPDIDKSAIYIPSMIIQPYLENAVKHGLLHKKGERWLKLSFDKQDNLLKVTVEDNGIGRERSAELNKIKNKSHQSFATQANEKRLDALNRGKSDTVSVRFIDKVSDEGEPQGTTVELLIAILEE